ncbi:MAG: bifunctional DedA family/phosphatase PAP2 family protein [Patescibacteria group bacterium]
MPYIHIFSAFVSHIEELISQGGYVFLFVTTTFEGVPLIGALIPGHITIIAGGFLAKMGVLNLWLVLLISAVGAIIGDYIGFKIGRKYGLSFIDRLRPYFFITDAHIEKTNAVLAKHTGKAMIIGRFSPITRALMPFLVGASSAPVKKFWLFNVIGGVTWTTSSIFVGYIFGAGYHVAAGYVGKFALFAIIAGLIIIWGYRFVNMRFHIFKKYELFMLILNLVSLYVLARTLQDAWSPNSFMANFDVYVNALMNGINQTHYWIRVVAVWVTTIGGTVATGGLGLAVGIYLIMKKRWRSAVIMLTSVGSTALVVGLVKAFFLRARPENALVDMLGDPSFPSGHAALAAAFFVIAGYLLVRMLHSWVYREIAIVLCVVAIVAIGLSRVVLNVHWVSDVVAGWSLGIFIASGSILFVRYVGALLVKKN